MIVALVAVGLCASPADAQKSLLKQFEDEFVALSDMVSPSVVEISVKSNVHESSSGRLNDMFKFFGLPSPDGEEEPLPDAPTPPPSMRPSATGTGFIIDADGHIVTNNHVVENATEVTVRLPNGKELIAEVIGNDPGADIAVIKIDPAGQNIVPVHLGSSENLKVGQFAIAIGSARGQTGSVSYGHISGLHRENLDLPDRNLRFQQFIQTDAAINLGNSGGPLCNIDGEVIGVNVAIVYDANSIGFAIPIDRVKRIIPQLIADGGVTRGWLGISIWNVAQAAENEEGGPVPLKDFIEAHGLTDSEGTYIRDVTVDGPAAAAGLQRDDIVLKVNDHKIVDTTDLINYVSDLEPGVLGTLDVWRNGKLEKLDITIGKFPGMMTAQYGRDYLGMHVTELQLRPEFMERLELDKQPSDFYVVEVVPGSPAEEAGIHSEDIVIEIAHQEVTTLEGFKSLLEEHARAGKTLFMRVTRLGEEPRKVYLKVPEDYAGH